MWVAWASRRAEAAQPLAGPDLRAVALAGQVQAAAFRDFQADLPCSFAGSWTSCTGRSHCANSTTAAVDEPRNRAYHRADMAVHATRITVSTFGALMGAAGIEHGIGEILQGNVRPGGLMILSWPEAAFFRVVSGEPAMTVIPNMLVTGTLALLLSAAYAVCAIGFPHRKGGPLAMMLLALGMLLFGGGLFPPVLALLLGLAARRIRAPKSWWARERRTGLRRLFGRAWGWIFALCALAWLALFPGLNLLDYALGVESPGLTVTIIVAALGTLALAVVSAYAHDAPGTL